MKKLVILVVLMFVCSCSKKQEKYIDNKEKHSIHNIDIRHVNLDSLKEVVLPKHEYIIGDELGLNGLSFEDIEKIYGNNFSTYWSPFVIENSLDVPEGYENVWNIKEYPVEMVAYHWARDSVMDLCLFFIKEKDTFVVIDGIQAEHDGLLLE